MRKNKIIIIIAFIICSICIIVTVSFFSMFRPTFRDTVLRKEMYGVSDYYFQRIVIPGYNRDLVLFARDSSLFHHVSFHRPKTLLNVDLVESGGELSISYLPDFDSSVGDTINRSRLLNRIKQEAAASYGISRGSFYPLNGEWDISVDSTGVFYMVNAPVHSLSFSFKKDNRLIRNIKPNENGYMLLFHGSNPLYVCKDTSSYDLDGREMLIPLSYSYSPISAREQRRLSKWLNKQRND